MGISGDYFHSTLSMLEHSGTVAGIAALVVGSCITLLQLDNVSRRILPPASLRIRRRLEQRHQLEQAIADQMLRAQANVCKTAIQVLSTEELPDLVQLLTSSLCKQSLILVGIATDTSVGASFQEWYLHMVLVDATVRTGQTILGRRIQVPLLPLTMQLADAFDAKVTGTAFCFIADASSGLGSRVLAHIAQECGAAMVVIQEPSWMTTLAYIAQQNLITQLKLERIVFALCRLQAWMARDQLGASKTIVYTLPGQSCTAVLLPLLHRVFPCERHVFVYDGCIDSVSRALFSTDYTKDLSRHVCTWNRSMSMSSTVTARIPITPLTNASSVSQPLYTAALSRLPSIHAGIVEAWMSSIDSFITLKTKSSPKDEQSGVSDEYLPFVCRLGILLGHAGRLGNGDKDQSDLAVVNILQYMTGSRSRPLAETIVSKAQDMVRDLQRMVEKAERPWDGKVKKDYGKAIEECVFAHKKILLGDKTLMDTVQPMKEWTLLAAKKISGCSCCLPGDDENENEDEKRKERINQSASIMNFAYVDGKSVFAFDPSRFGR